MEADVVGEFRAQTDGGVTLGGGQPEAASRLTGRPGPQQDTGLPSREPCGRGEPT